ncbi:hypothetical protein WNY77_20870, partial [Paraglaciecola mesophila]
GQIYVGSPRSARYFSLRIFARYAGSYMPLWGSVLNKVLIVIFLSLIVPETHGAEEVSSQLSAFWKKLDLPEECEKKKSRNSLSSFAYFCTDENAHSGILRIQLVDYDYSEIINTFDEIQLEYDYLVSKIYVQNQLEIFELLYESGENLGSFFCDSHKCIYFSGSYKGLSTKLKAQLLNGT